VALIVPAHRFPYIEKKAATTLAQPGRAHAHHPFSREREKVPRKGRMRKVVTRWPSSCQRITFTYIEKKAITKRHARPDTEAAGNRKEPRKRPAADPKLGMSRPNLAESGLSKRFAAEAHKVIAHFTKMSRIRFLAARRRPLR